LLGRTLRIEASPPKEAAILLGTSRSLAPSPSLPPEAYLLREVTTGGVPRLLITGGDERGVLYGTFALLRKIALGDMVAALDETRAPFAPVRMLDHWDNLDGTIERGYAGA